MCIGFGLKPVGVCLALALSAALPMQASGQTVVVTATSSEGWIPQFSGTASGEFVPGPELPPVGSGSFEFRVGADGDSAAQLRNVEFDGVPLSEITTLTYNTYVQEDGSGGQAPYLILHIDQDDDGDVDDLLFFEPVYQTGDYSGDPVPDQGDLVVGEWQTWDALEGGWWSLNDMNFGPPLVTLATYLEENPDAVIRNTESGEGGLRIVTGFGAPAWDGFVGNVDSLTIAIGNEEVTYDFEATLVIDDCDTGVVDLVIDEEGTRLSDRIAELAATARNHGQFVKGVAQLTNQLKKDGLISGAEKGAIQSCAAESSLP